MFWSMFKVNLDRFSLFVNCFKYLIRHSAESLIVINAKILDMTGIKTHSSKVMIDSTKICILLCAPLCKYFAAGAGDDYVLSHHFAKYDTRVLSTLLS